MAAVQRVERVVSAELRLSLSSTMNVKRMGEETRPRDRRRRNLAGSQLCRRRRC